MFRTVLLQRIFLSIFLTAMPVIPLRVPSELGGLWLSFPWDGSREY